MRTTLFVQARLNSNRITEKMLKTLYKDKTIIYLALQSAVEKIPYDDKALLIPYSETQYFKEVASEFGFEIIEGPEDDVLGRFILGLSIFPNTETVIRVCADKVIHDEFWQKIVITQHKEYPCDLTHIADDPIRSVTSEVYKANSLITANMFYPYGKGSIWNKYREHIKPLFFKNSDGKDGTFWNVNTVPITKELKQHLYPFNISIDTEEDLEIMRNLFSDLYTGRALDFLEVLDWFAKNK